MKMIKKIFLVSIVLVLALSVKIFAVETGETITYNGITTTMPEIVSLDEIDKEEDPLYVNLSKTPSLMAANGDNSVSSIISKFETSGDAAVGIDVSYYQGNVNWKEVASSGVKFAIIRCGGRGLTTGAIFEDTKFREYVQGAIDNGIYVGIYFYSAAINEEEALQEAAAVVNMIKGYDIRYPVAYDFENFSSAGYRTDGLSIEQINKNGKTFLSYIRNAGYTAMLYGSSSPLNTKWDSEIRSNYDVWVAHYKAEKPSYTGNYNIWQYTSEGSVPGISGNVDIDIDYTYYMRLHNIDITNYIFDATYYADKYPDLKAAFGYNTSALKQHYETNGKKEGRMASPVFDPMYYLNKYPDLKAAFGTNYEAAYNHFRTNGINENRVGSKYFDVNYYISNNSDVKKAYYSSKTYSLVHFVQNGLNEGRQGSSEFNVKNYYNSQSSYTKKQLGTSYIKYYALADGGNPINDKPINITNYMFDSKYYADKYPDLKAAFGYNTSDLKQHYEVHGKKEGRMASPVFDPVYYINKYSDLKAAFGTNYEAAYNHFIANGINEGRQGSSEFNVVKYINNYADLQEVFGPNYSKALEHYMVNGRNEGRIAV